MKASIRKVLLLLSTVVILLLVVLLATEGLLRIKFSDTAYVPGPTMLRAQSYMKEHPKLGYLYKENINYDDNILIPWSDQDVYPFSTDNIGFVNHPQAIKARQEKKHIDVLGLGDSNIHVSAFPLHDFFFDHGLQYYSMAMPSHSPPQYNIILKDYAVSLHPDWIIYGVSENDFDNIVAFEPWQQSNRGWLEYHSGYFFGPPQSASPVKRFLKKHFRGIYAQYRSTRQAVKRLVLEGMKQSDLLMTAGARTDRTSVEKLFNYVQDAYTFCKKNDIQFLVILIPGKATETQGETFKSYLYDELLQMLEDANIPTMDLRETFSPVKDRSTLFYKLDSHWNKNGITLAGQAVLKHIQEEESP